MKKAFIESETVKIIIMVAIMAVLIGVLILVRKQYTGGVESFFDIWKG